MSEGKHVIDLAAMRKQAAAWAKDMEPCRTRRRWKATGWICYEYLRPWRMCCKSLLRLLPRP